MSDPSTRLKNSKRRFKTAVASKRQYTIAKGHGIDADPEKLHKFAKRHAMDCGNPRCGLCGNPRRSKLLKTKERLTTQEKRFFQGTDHCPNRHGVGLPKSNEND